MSNTGLRIALATFAIAAVLVVGVLLVAPRGAQGPPAAPTESPTPPATIVASPAAVLDDRFGFIATSIAGDPPSRRATLRRENDPTLVGDLAESLGSPRRSVMSNYQTLFSDGLAVSADGRRLAYWTAIGAEQSPVELQVLEISSGARPRTVLALTPEFGDVVGESVVWSSDGTGLVLGVGTSPFRCGADAPSCPPKFSALYQLEAAGGKPREIASTRGNSIVPVAWDRQTRVVAAFESEGRDGGRVLAYDVIEEGGALKRTQMVIGTGGNVTVAASYDAKQVLAHEYSSPGQVVRVWPLASPENAVVLSPGGEQILAPARWLPGKAEIGVLFESRLELWNATGARQRIPLPPLPPSREGFRPFLFRVDGSAAFVGRYFQTPSYVAIDLSSGRSAAIPGEEWLSASVRVGP